MAKPQNHVLEFERPLLELESKLEEMRALRGDEPSEDLNQAIGKLEARVHELRQSIYKNLTRWQRVQIARHPLRPYSLDHIHAWTEGFQELHGDRLFADDPAMVAGLATFKGGRYGYKDRTAVVVGQQKGRDTKMRKYRRFGMSNPEGYRKALRLMRMAAKFNKPVICLLDTPGAFPGMEAEERGQAEAIARNLFEMARLPVPIVVVVIGEGASGGALGIGVGDRILMMENAWYSVISPESCSSILWRSWDYKEEAARGLKLTAPDLKPLRIIDDIIPEPLGGAHHDPETAFAATGKAIAKALAELDGVAPDVLLEQRLAKFDAMGVFEAVESVEALAG
ncbi:MAG: acetyl-CoA carboxylase carboxyltransferase subunit alpha [Rhodothermales bacterium]|nr:acetyl-CoA carboxylase carboxyltransferase subunit alpha [Rhodothermales bacterium]MBO6779157.1 acetyl-CoA carboxylase carboxyltransferase subunit alpha [Rhodothermales bacterium]